MVLLARAAPAKHRAVKAAITVLMTRSFPVRLTKGDNGCGSAENIQPTTEAHRYVPPNQKRLQIGEPGALATGGEIPMGDFPPVANAPGSPRLPALFFLGLAEKGGLVQREKHDFLACHGADVVVQAQH